MKLNNAREYSEKEVDVEKLSAEILEITGEKFPANIWLEKGAPIAKKLWAENDIKDSFLEIQKEKVGMTKLRKLWEVMDNVETMRNLEMVLSGLPKGEGLESFEDVLRDLQLAVTDCELEDEPQGIVPGELINRQEYLVQQKYRRDVQAINKLSNRAGLSRMLFHPLKEIPVGKLTLRTWSAEGKIISTYEDHTTKSSDILQRLESRTDSDAAQNERDALEYMNREFICENKTFHEENDPAFTFNRLQFFHNTLRYKELDALQKRDARRGIYFVLLREQQMSYSLKPLFLRPTLRPLWRDVFVDIELSDLDLPQSELFEAMKDIWRDDSQKGGYAKSMPYQLRDIIKEERKNKCKGGVLSPKIEKEQRKVEKAVEKQIKPGLPTKFFRSIGENTIGIENSFGAEILRIFVGTRTIDIALGNIEDGVVKFNEIEEVKKYLEGQVNCNVKAKCVLLDAAGKALTKEQDERLRKPRDEKKQVDIRELEIQEKIGGQVKEVIKGKENFEEIQEDLAALLELVGLEDIDFVSENGTYVVRFSKKIMEEFVGERLPFDLVVDLQTREVSSEVELLPELKLKMEMYAGKYMRQLEKNLEMAKDELIAVKRKEAEEAAQKERMGKINEIKKWYSDIMNDSVAWRGVRNRDIEFRHQADVYRAEGFNPDSLVVRLKSAEAQAKLEIFNQQMPEGLRLNMRHENSVMVGEVATPWGDVGVGFSRKYERTLVPPETLDSEIEGMLRGMAAAILNAVFLMFGEEMGLYDRYEQNFSKRKKPKEKKETAKEKREKIVYKNALAMAKKKLDKGEAIVVLSRDENDFVSSVKYNCGWKEAEMLGGEILLINSLVRFPEGRADVERPKFDVEKYEALQEALGVSRNKKYFIRRLQNAICCEEGRDNPKAKAEPIHDSVFVKLLREVIDASDFDIEEFAKAEHAASYLDELCSGENWIDVLINDMKVEEYPLISVQHASTCDLSDLSNLED